MDKCNAMGIYLPGVLGVTARPGPPTTRRQSSSSNEIMRVTVEYQFYWTFLGSSTRQLIIEYYLHWTTTFEISFSGSSDTNYDSLL